MIEDGFSSTIAARIAGLPLGSLMQFASTGLLVPSLSAPLGRGTSRRYNFGDLCALRFVSLSRAFGASPSLLLPLMRHVQTLPLEMNTQCGLVLIGHVSGDVPVSEIPFAELPQYILRSPVGLVVVVDELVAEVRAAYEHVMNLLDGQVRGRGRPPKQKLETEPGEEHHEREDKDGGVKLGKNSSAKGGIK